MKKQPANTSFDLTDEIKPHLLTVRGQLSLLDRDVAAIYGVETRVVNQAVKNNPNKFPAGYVVELSESEFSSLRSKILTANISSKSRALPKVFTERGLYMLATILKGERAVHATLAIIETYAQVRALKRELVDLHREIGGKRRTEKMRHFGEALADIVMPDLDVVETESSLELNFFVGKLKHTVKRIKKQNGGDATNEIRR